MNEGPSERVRFCLACGEMVDYGLRRCPSCGHYEPLARAPEAGPLQDCPACGKPVGAQYVFCPACGVERGLERSHVDGDVAHPAARATRDMTLWLWGLTLMGPLALIVALWLLLV